MKHFQGVEQMSQVFISSDGSLLIENRRRRKEESRLSVIRRRGRTQMLSLKPSQKAEEGVFELFSLLTESAQNLWAGI